MTARPRESVVVVTCEYPPFPGGIGTYAGSLVEAVRQAGFPATVIAPTYREFLPPTFEPDTHRILGHHKISPTAALRVLSIILRAPHDALLLAADIRSVLLIWATWPIHRRPYRAMIHGSEVSKFRPGSPTFALVKAAYHGAELICSNSHATLEIFSACFGPPRREAVTYLGVEPAWFDPAHGSFEDGALNAIMPEETIVCAVGRIEPRKGQLETVQALAMARDRFGLRQPVFVVAGRPEDIVYTRALHDEAAKMGVTLIAPGRVSDGDLKRLFAISSCHTLLARALPGKIEGFGLVLLEAAAQGCPSVATRVGGIPEVMGDTGSLVGPDDIAAVASAIARYDENHEFRLAAGVSARTRARSFSWLSCAQNTFPELAWRK